MYLMSLGFYSTHYKDLKLEIYLGEGIDCLLKFLLVTIGKTYMIIDVCLIRMERLI